MENPWWKEKDGRKVMRKRIQYEIKKRAVGWINARIALNKLRKIFGAIAKQAALCGKDRQLMRAGNNNCMSRKKFRRW